MNNFGKLDPSFGILGSGLVITDFGGKDDYARSVAIDPSSGNIIVAGYSGISYTQNNNWDFALACYKPDGQLDASFGTLGKVTTIFGPYNDAANSVAIDQKRGKIIVAGYTSYSVNGSKDFALACYNPNGQLDASFGTLGKVTTNFGQNTSNEAFSVAIDPSTSKIIVAGLTMVNGTYDFALACYNPNGQLDASFGTLGTGLVTTDFGGNYNELGFSVAINPTSSKIIVAGIAYNPVGDYSFALACYNPNGQLDTSFGTLGKVITDMGINSYDQANSVAIDPKSGKIIVAGYGFGLNTQNGLKFSLACYNPNGQLDTSFGTLGKVITAFSTGYEDLGYSVAIDPTSSNIIVAGHAYNITTNDYNYALACYSPNGQLDASFGTLGTGLVTTDFGGNIENKGSSLAINPISGNIIVVGNVYNQSHNFSLACYYGVKPEQLIFNICFPANTLISTNQGNIAIQNLDPKIHTIRNKKIELITKTITHDKYLVCFEKDSLGINTPSEKTIITKNHLIYYKGSVMKAKDFINKFENVKKIKYNGESLYNVLLKQHDKMMVNNLICETLDPENKVCQLFKTLSNLSLTDQNHVIKVYNDYAIKNNIFSSKR